MKYAVKPKDFGFTLLELLMVIGIIGILAGVIIANFPRSNEKAQTANAMRYANSLRAALQYETVGWWKLDEGSGAVAKDTWWDQKHGAISTGVTWTDGIFEKALLFNGSGNVDLGTSIDDKISGAFTISAWMKGSTPGLLAKTLIGWNTSNHYPSIMPMWINSRAIIYFSGNNFKLWNHSPVNINDAKWHHIVFVITGSGQADIADARMYADGKLQTSAAFDMSGGALARVNARIGRSSCCNGWAGVIDDVQIYGMALPQSTIEKLYAESKEKYYPFLVSQ